MWHGSRNSVPDRKCHGKLCYDSGSAAKRKSCELHMGAEPPSPTVAATSGPSRKWKDHLVCGRWAGGEREGTAQTQTHNFNPPETSKTSSAQMCCGRGVRVYVCLRWPGGGHVSESCVVGRKERMRSVVMAAVVAVLMLSVVGDLWQASPKVASFPVQVNVSPSFQTSSSCTLHSDTSPHSQDASFEPRCISSLITVSIAHTLSRTHPLTLNITFQRVARPTLYILWTIPF